MERVHVEVLVLNWWMLALRGVLAILFGVVAFFWPGLFWLTVVFVFSAYALLDGCLAITTALMNRQASRWWALILEGMVGIAAGAVAFLWPGITELALLYLIAAWCIATGVFEVAAAIRLREYIDSEWLLGLAGVLSILLGVALAGVPLAGLLVVAWWVGAYAIVFGALLLVLAFRLRSLERRITRPGAVAMR